MKEHTTEKVYINDLAQEYLDPYDLAIIEQISAASDRQAADGSLVESNSASSGTWQNGVIICLKGGHIYYSIRGSTSRRKLVGLIVCLLTVVTAAENGGKLIVLLLNMLSGT